MRKGKMSKKKLLSVLIIGLIVFGVFTFVLTNYLHAGDYESCNTKFAECASDCFDFNNPSIACFSNCAHNFGDCLER
jgi:hypothetical protein